MQRRNKEEGYVLVMVAILLFVLLSFASLAVDIGTASTARAAAQRAADAAALSGAFTFVTNPTAADPAAFAEGRARQVAYSNTITGEAIAAGDVTVSVDVANRRVTVTVAHTQDTFFGGAIGPDTTSISATAVAEASSNAVGSGCTKPWFIPNTALAPQNEEICDTTNKQGKTVKGACSLGHVLINTATGQPTSWGLGKIGTQFTIKPKNPNSAPAPGQFYGIRLGDSQGGNDYRTNIATCSPNALYCAQSYTTENGDMVGPTKQGVLDLICQSDKSNPGCPKDSFVSVGQYRDPNGNPIETSRSLVVAPVINICTFCPSLPSGQTTLQVVGFALVFLDGLQGDDVRAHLINIMSCPAGGGGGGGGSGPPITGPFSVPVRLVRTS